VEEAARIGCGAVKFQLFKIDELFAPEILTKSQRHRDRRQWELPLSFLQPLSERSHELGMEFSCTPFYLDAVQELEPWVDFYKIASYELLWHDLLRACARTGKPVMLSTGMANMSEITSAVKALVEEGCRDISVLHCVSHYPTLPEECNLAYIENIRNKLSEQIPTGVRWSVGWSDHSVSPGVINRAVNHWQASNVEFHLDLDQDGYEFGAKHCWLPEQMAPVIEKSIKNEEKKADGLYEKVLCPDEIIERGWRADPSDGLRPLLKIRDEFEG
jgi:N-acetylneuraminate synthase